jgi:orotidine-5'-phosphate decarboxylase
MLVSARDRLIVALDLPTVTAAEEAVINLGDSVSFYKIGLELILTGGVSLISNLVGMKKQVFLDLKLHDIANTVTRTTERAAELGVTFLTVHAFPQTMRAAVKGRHPEHKLKLLAVTVLTSWDDSDVRESEYSLPLRDLVRRRAQQAHSIGVDGLVASAAEAADLRRQVGDKLLLVTPGIRPAGSAADDQKRVVTPAAAIAAGVDYLVVGRPILTAPDPKAAAQAIVAEIESAMQ